MASRRQIKKVNKRNLKKVALQKLNELEALRVEEEQIDREIEKLKKTISSKKATLSELQSSVAKLDQISLRAQELAVEATQKAKPAEIAKTEMPDSAKSYVAIKKYHDYIDKGIIREQSILDKYQIQDFMERIMNQDEYDKYVEESVQKGEELLRKDAERRMKRAEERRSRFAF